MTDEQVLSQAAGLIVRELANRGHRELAERIVNTLLLGEEISHGDITSSILGYLSERGPTHYRDIASGLGIDLEKIRQCCSLLKRRGKIIKTGLATYGPLERENWEYINTNPPTTTSPIRRGDISGPIIRYLVKNGPTHIQDLATKLDISLNMVRQQTSYLFRTGKIDRESRGVYAPKENSKFGT